MRKNNIFVNSTSVSSTSLKPAHSKVFSGGGKTLAVIAFAALLQNAAIGNELPAVQAGNNIITGFAANVPSLTRAENNNNAQARHAGLINRHAELMNRHAELINRHPELVSGSVNAYSNQNAGFEIGTRNSGSYENFKMLNQVWHDKNFGSLDRYENDNINEKITFNGMPTGFAADITPTLGDNSAYTLTEVDAAGNNIITEYEVVEVTRYYDKTTGAYVAEPQDGVEYKVVEEKDLVPHYYSVDLKTTTYGEGSQSQTYTVNGVNGGTYTITANYDSTNERINNNSTIGDITGDFINNSNAAIDNKGTIGDITSNFIANNYDRDGGDYFGGGAIDNKNRKSIIGDITGDFIGNYALYGGAIFNNEGTIGDITSDFIGNYGYIGGAIFNTGTIGNITGDFIGNYAHAAYYKYGGAIYNRDTINDITGDFIGNYVVKSSYAGNYSYSYGGAIDNRGTIGNITGNFLDNYISSDNLAYGGAIFNDEGTIGNIKGDFTGNYIISDKYAYGGFIMNYVGTIGNITGNFISNYASGSSSSYSGAVCNYAGTIGNITGDFIGNYAKSEAGETYGGAIFNWVGTIGNITGDFIKNYAEGFSTTYGGAIVNYDDAIIGVTDDDGNVTGGIINSSFINNYAKSETGEAMGGAIYTTTDLNIIAQDGQQSVFSGNYTETAGVKDYNAIYVDNAGAALAFKAQNNGIISMYDNINGTSGYGLELTGDGSGLISFTSTSADHMANFNNAKVTADNLNVNLNYNDGTIENYTPYSMTINDSANVSLALDIDNDQKSADTVTASGGISTGVITINAINFINDELQPTGEYKIQILKLTDDSTLQLAIADNLLNPDEALDRTESILSDTITADVNWNEKFQAYTNVKEYYGKLGLATTDTTNDSIGVSISRINEYTEAAALGDTLSVWAEQAAPVDENGDEVERSFNFDTAEDIYTVTADLGTPTEGTLNINGVTDDDGNHSTIDLDGHEGFELSNDTTLNINNITLTGNENLLTVTNENAEVNLDNVILNGDISSTAEYKMNITGETDLNGSVSIAEVTIGIENDEETNGRTIVTPNSYDNFAAADVTTYGGTVNLINDAAEYQIANSFYVAGDTIFNVDADLAKYTMDRLPSNTTVADGAMIHVNQINLLSDSKTETTVIPFAYDGFKNSVDYIGQGNLSKDTQVTTAFAPIYKYGVSYNRDDGQFTFVRGTSGKNGQIVVPSNPSDAFNPAVLSSPAAAETGAAAAINTTMHYAFQNSDNFMMIPYFERAAYLNKNKYALSAADDTNSIGVFSPLYTQNEEKSIWVKPYATFENVPLKNGPKVSNIAYGTLIGYDTGIKELKHGWARTWTGYIGYNGASQRYSGVNSTLNGGLLGGTLTMYKKNFFNATTVSTGSIVGENTNMYGHENYTMLMAGIGNKTGCNFEFKEGKYIIQPNLLLSYTFVNTFDYTNAAGVKINSDPLHTIQISPGVKFIGNFKNGWQPYVGVNMVWNIMGESNVTANGVNLPEMSIKPYVQYGAGIQKRIKDHFMAYGQAMIQNGGRNGISLSGGFRWAIGHDCHNKVEKVKTPAKNLKAHEPQKINKDIAVSEQNAHSERKILKQMTAAQKSAYIRKNYNTTLTAKTAVLKQL